jgi:hypothetical protein
MIAMGILEETRFGWALGGYGIWITKCMGTLLRVRLLIRNSVSYLDLAWHWHGRWWSVRRIHMLHCNAFILVTGRADGADAGEYSFLTDRLTS